MQEHALSAAGNPLIVSTENGSDRVRVTLRLASSAEWVLHWGMRGGGASPWRSPPRESWPNGTMPADDRAVRTPFEPAGADQRVVSIELETPSSPTNLAFVLYLPNENRWVKNGREDFVIPLPRSKELPETALAQWAPPTASRRTFQLDSGHQLAAAIQREDQNVRVVLVSDVEPPALLHWGLAERTRYEWKAPDQLPPGTTLFENQAARTPFTVRNGLSLLELTFARRPDGSGPRAMRFVLFQPESGEWLKQSGAEMMLPLFERQTDGRLGSARLQDLAEAIIEAEVGSSYWTLMHRFNLCHDLLHDADTDPEALALLFAWLRYSAIRQLDWQRNYNTKPRELSHAQDRLTQRLAAVWPKHRPGSAGRYWARALFTTLGRGGEGQRVRDEILHIMHRNNLKEVRPSFVEEWHQKLHNNTTPDDVVICEAYLAFLREDGDVAEFNRTLEAGGVSRARLASYERPVTSDPIFLADRKAALIPEFENFLRILKALHSGTDLETAVNAARSRLDAATTVAVESLRKADQDDIDAHAEGIGTARAALAPLLEKILDDAARRDLLFLDLALEQALRDSIERHELATLEIEALLALLHAAVHNVNQSLVDVELGFIEQHADALLEHAGDNADAALQALSVVERLTRWLQAHTVAIHDQLQPKAEYLGGAFGAEKWVIPLFSEEAVRGGPVFAVSRLLHLLAPKLRQTAGLGGWQVVSPAETFGRVRVVPNLLGVQTEHFSEPVVLISDEVSGEEEIPAGVQAVLTSSHIDLVSHVAVRARNAGVLLAVCFDSAELEELRKHAGRTMAVRVTPAGDVDYEERADSPVAATPTPAPEPRRSAPQPALTAKWAIPAEEFTPAIVGGKSNNLNGLRGRLPDSIHLPRSVALPFGVLERTLEAEANRPVREQIDTQVRGANANLAEILAQVRAQFARLSAPTELKGALLDIWQRAGLPATPWEQIWHGITRVWASTWNERAYLSRTSRGIPHSDLRMAVLIQQVVEADYAFVIHTANPINRNRDELVAEVVLGLGETLVGNYPGRALGFVAHKADGRVRLLSYPSKSIGLFGRGVIFRSDSNGEDLQGFAGAGLYDSFLAEPPEERRLDYSKERLIGDERFRSDLLRSILRAGHDVERVLGTPQDIEGAVSGGRLYIVQTRPQVGL